MADRATRIQIEDDDDIVIDPATEGKQDNIITQVTKSTSPVIYNTTMTLADTEYSQALPASCKAITVQNRGAYDTKVCYTSGESGTTYFTIKSGMNYYEDRMILAGSTLYFQCATAGQVLEIIAYS